MNVYSKKIKVKRKKGEERKNYENILRAILQFQKLKLNIRSY